MTVLAEPRKRGTPNESSVKTRNPSLVTFHVLLRSLIDPRADQTNLLGRERPDVCLVVGWRHPGIVVGGCVRDAFDNKTVGAVAGRDDLAVLAALERVFQGVELQFGFWFVAAVTFDAGLVENRFDVSGISYAGFR